MRADGTQRARNFVAAIPGNVSGACAQGSWDDTAVQGRDQCRAVNVSKAEPPGPELEGAFTDELADTAAESYREYRRAIGVTQATAA